MAIKMYGLMCHLVMRACDRGSHLIGAIVFAIIPVILPLIFVQTVMADAGIMLDPGHSPQKPGAMSASGNMEYLYNDLLAARVRDYLSRRKIPVEVTRKKNEELSLAARAARSAGKKLFISLHHDSVQPQFVKKINQVPTSDKARGYSLFVSRKNPYFYESLEYARAIGKSLRAQGLKPSLHHAEPIKGENRQLLDANLGIYAFDDLVVLKQARSPALLLEAAVIVNPADEILARDDRYRDIIAEGIYRGATSR